MKVHKLHALLTEHIIKGRGDDDIYITLNDGFMDVTPTNEHGSGWALTDMDGPDGDDADEAFINLHGQPETPEMAAQTTAAIRDRAAR